MFELRTHALLLALSALSLAAAAIAGAWFIQVARAVPAATTTCVVVGGASSVAVERRNGRDVVVSRPTTTTVTSCSTP